MEVDPAEVGPEKAGPEAVREFAPEVVVGEFAPEAVVEDTSLSPSLQRMPSPAL